jgi:hypothetical protein
MRKLLPLVAALALVAVAAGCGGDDDGETTAAPAPPPETPTALSKEELIAQGDAICAEVNAAVGTVDATSSEDAASQVAELYTGMVDRLEDLGQPSDDAAGYDEVIATAEQLAQAQSDVRLAAERGEAEGVATAEAEASAALSSFQEAAGSYGLQECGEGPSAPAPGAAPVEAGGGEEEAAEGVEEEEAPEEIAPEEVEEAPETGGAGSVDEEGEAPPAGGGAEAGGGAPSGGETGGGSAGGIGPG